MYFYSEPLYIKDFLHDLNVRYPASDTLDMNQIMEFTQFSRSTCIRIMEKYGKKKGHWTITKASFAVWVYSKKL